MITVLSAKEHHLLGIGGELAYLLQVLKGSSLNSSRTFSDICLKELFYAEILLMQGF
jgi:hypothetical protein